MKYRCNAYGENIPGNYADPQKASEEDIRNPVKVLCYEFFELGNTDILETLMPVIQKKNPELANWMRICCDDIEELGYVEDFYEADRERFCQKIIEEFSNAVGKEIRFCLWLTDYDSVKKFYCRSSEDEITAYEESNIILSDLGVEGTLYGYEEMPKIQ